MTMNSDQVRSWKEAGVSHLRYHQNIRLERLKKTRKPISQDSRHLGRDSNPELAEYEARKLMNSSIMKSACPFMVFIPQKIWTFFIQMHL